MRVTLAMLGALVMSIASSQVGGADASGCSDTACVGVRGNGTWVSQVQGGVVVDPDQTVTGFSHISGGGIDVTTSTETYSNPSGGLLDIKTGPVAYRSDWYTVNRSVASGTRVCSTFWKKNPKGDFSAYGTACETVHS
jgi:hypothetical protein